jgi:hypothetical protein
MTPRARFHDDLVTPRSTAGWLGWTHEPIKRQIVREYGPFPGVDHVHGVTYDGAASGSPPETS